MTLLTMYQFHNDHKNSHDNTPRNIIHFLNVLGHFQIYLDKYLIINESYASKCSNKVYARADITA